MAIFRACYRVTFAVFFLGTQAICAQSILGTNLIVNGNAEAGPAGTSTTQASTIPGWTVTGKANVLPYGLTGYLLTTSPAPPDHGFQYFAGFSDGSATLTQTIDVSSGASAISAGNVKFTASAYLGSLGAGGNTTQLTVAFQNANGQTFSTATLGPTSYPGLGLSQQEAIGLVPTGTLHITVTLTLTYGGGCAADSLSLVLTTLNTSPGTVLGTNLIVNGGAEQGPSAPPTLQTPAPYIPGWATSGEISVCPYGGSGFIATSDPSPLNPGVNLFCGLNDAQSMYQDLDVSAAGSLIDSKQVTFDVSAWLGGLVGDETPVLTYVFYDWSGNQLAPTAELGPQDHSGRGLVELTNTGTLPSGTRRVHISLEIDQDDLVDNINFTLGAPPAQPVITPGGIVSASSFGGFTSIAPGSWIEIYGSELAAATQTWAAANFVNNVAPTSLGGATVSIGGQPAYIDYVSPGQIDAQVPSNVSTGAVPVTVTDANGTSDQFWLDVNATEPGLLAPASFLIGGKQYVAAIFSDGQTFAIPTGAIPGVPSRPAAPGDTLTIYGIGFGPVNTGVTAGTIVTAQNSLTTPVTLQFGSATATLEYQGLAPSFVGLYQFNVVVPTVAANSALPLSFTLGGTKGTQTLYIAVQE